MQNVMRCALGEEPREIKAATPTVLQAVLESCPAMRVSFLVLVCVTLILCQGPGVSWAQECPLPQLLAGVPSQSPQEVEETPLIPACDPSNQTTGECTIEFPEGTVTYNGNTTNSTAVYTAVDEYCINDTRERVCEAGMWLDSVIFEEVATEHFLEAWNIVLIVIGVLAFIIGDGITAALGMMFFMRSVQLIDKVIAVVMLVVSIVVVLPVAGPVALITYCVVKKTKKDQKAIKLKVWYRILNIVSILLKLIGVLMWLVQAGYSATQDFYGEGPLRDENGMCVPHEPNTTERRVQDALVVVSHVVSILVAIDGHVKSLLAKKGTKSVGKDDTDFGRKKPKKSKDKEKEKDEELEQFPAQPSGDAPSSPTALIQPSEEEKGYNE